MGLTRYILPLIWVGLILISNAILFQPLSDAQEQAKAFWPQPLDANRPPQFFCRIIHSYPHDPDAFTQGLIFSDGYFFEGTGLKGRSSLRKVEPMTGRVIKIKPLPAPYFGEGIARLNNRLIQLTWKSGAVFSYDADSFQTVDTFHWPREGWGITTDGTQLIISDGTHQLYFADPHTFDVSHTLPVTAIKGPVARLNELEWVEGFILANVWQTDNIVVVDPKTGRVVAWIALDGLAAESWQGVPNGIAYDHNNRRLYVTGKRWPKIFEVILTAEP